MLTLRAFGNSPSTDPPRSFSPLGVLACLCQNVEGTIAIGDDVKGTSDLNKDSN